MSQQSDASDDNTLKTSLSVGRRKHKMISSNQNGLSIDNLTSDDLLIHQLDR